MIKTPFVRVGNKTRMLNDIIPIIPKHKKYVECFLGSGALFFAKESAEQTILNDLDPNIYYLFSKLPDISDKKEDYNFITGVEKIQDFCNKDHEKIEDEWYKRLLYTANTFSGLGKGKIYKEHSHESKFKNIKKWKEKMKNTIVLNEDYIEVLKKYDDENTFIFLDPPYEKSKTKAKMYKNDDIDYYKMAEILKKLKGKFLLTLNASPQIKEIFNMFNIIEVDVLGGRGGLTQPIGQNRKEYIINNYIKSYKT